MLRPWKSDRLRTATGLHDPEPFRHRLAMPAEVLKEFGALRDLELEDRLDRLAVAHRVDEAALAVAAAEKDRRERAQTFRDLQILMLDGLADPIKRSEAIQQFVRLYRTPIRSGARQDARSGCTGC